MTRAEWQRRYAAVLVAAGWAEDAAADDADLDYCCRFDTSGPVRIEPEAAAGERLAEIETARERRAGEQQEGA